MEVIRKCIRALCCLLLCCLLAGLPPKAAALEIGTGRRTEPAAGNGQPDALELMGGGELDWVCGVPFDDPGWTVRDDGGEVCAAPVHVHGAVKPWLVGDYELLYTLTRADGRTFSARRTVHVRPAAELPETVARKKTIYLTFDDGPYIFTEEVLDILARYNVKATFFVVTSRSRCDALLPRIVEEGHALGIHCHEHNMATLYGNWDAYFFDLMCAQETVHRITGDYAHIVRLPGGSRTAELLIGTLDGGQAEFEDIMHAMGLRYYDWNIQPESGIEDSETEFRRFSQPKKPYDSVVVLLHETRQYSVRALESMIRWGLDNGYSFAPIDLTTPEVHAELLMWQASGACLPARAGVRRQIPNVTEENR